jgi:acetylornithine aminotransferase
LSATWQTKYQAPFAPLIPGFVEATYNSIDSINELVNEKTCGVIVEPIQGEGGIMQASEEWLRSLRKRCDEVNAVLIYDEIQVCATRFRPIGILCGTSAYPPAFRGAFHL